jgi:hypothetical protein
MATPLLEIGDGWHIVAEDISGMRPHDGTPPGGTVNIIFQFETNGVDAKPIRTWVLLTSATMVGSPFEFDHLLARWKETLEIASGEVSLAGHST